MELTGEQVAEDCSAGQYFRLRVRDNGPGIKEETRKRIFEPFFTTKDVDKGTGLGLSTALGVMQEHGGWIDCDSTPGSGACFDLYLPATSTTEFPMESPVPVNECESQGQGSETILVIDDEEIIRQTAVQMLERRGFQTLSAEDGEAGLAVYRDNQQQVDLVLLDHSMPRISGLETLQALRQFAPEI